MSTEFAVRVHKPGCVDDATNNVAEYCGLLDSLEHALNNPQPYVCFRVDSMLVARQATCRWRCLAVGLKPYYETVIVRLNALRALGGVEDVVVEHVHREFNSDADGMCNAALDLPPTHCPDAHGFVLNLNWRPHSATHDLDGDMIMRPP